MSKLLFVCFLFFHEFFLEKDQDNGESVCFPCLFVSFSYFPKPFSTFGGGASGASPLCAYACRRLHMQCVRDEIQEIICLSSTYAYLHMSPVGIRTPADWSCHPSEAGVVHRILLCHHVLPMHRHGAQSGKMLSDLTVYIFRWEPRLMLCVFPVLPMGTCCAGSTWCYHTWEFPSHVKKTLTPFVVVAAALSQED